MFYPHLNTQPYIPFKYITIRSILIHNHMFHVYNISNTCIINVSHKKIPAPFATRVFSDSGEVVFDGWTLVFDGWTLVFDSWTLVFDGWAAIREFKEVESPVFQILSHILSNYVNLFHLFRLIDRKSMQSHPSNPNLRVTPSTFSFI